MGFSAMFMLAFSLPEAELCRDIHYYTPLVSDLPCLDTVNKVQTSLAATLGEATSELSGDFDVT